MDGAGRGRRRIDRILAPSFLDDLHARSAGEIRSMRDDCRQEESRLSYARRLLQARLDIVAAETSRRESGASGALLDALPAILAGARSEARGSARPVSLYAPEDSDGRREGDAVFDDPTLAGLADMDVEGLRAFQARLAEDERETSAIRSQVQDRLDRLQSELVRRYRDGEAAVDEIVGARAGSAGDDGPSAG